MSKTQFVDFKAIKAVITMEKVLEHYGIIDRFKRTGDSLSGPCPIHKGTNPTQFRVSVSKNLWNCFSECKKGGNVLDFIARMENSSIHAAALKAVEWFGIDSDAMQQAKNGPNTAPQSDSLTIAGPAINKADAKQSGPIGYTPNPPLKFRLEKLDGEHPYLAKRGLTPETIAEFGMGYCSKGMMTGRIAIPIKSPQGNVVAYAGRFAGEPAGDVPKYKFPQGFRKSLELFNIDRAIKEPSNKPLVIVEGFFGCINLYQHGCRKVVALMGSTMSAAQEVLIRKYSAPHSQALLLLDEDEAGRIGRDDIALRLAKFLFVRIYIFDEEGRQPDNLSADELAELLA